MAFTLGSFLGGPGGSLLGGLLGGIFPNQPQMDPAQRRIYDFQMQNAEKERQFSQSVPLSDPQELAALAQQRGMLGQEQLAGQARLQSQQPFLAGQSNQGDFLGNLTNQQVGQRAALTAQMLQQALQDRRNALLQSSQMAMGAYAPAAAPRQQQPDVAGAVANFMRDYAKQKAMGQGQGGGGGNVQSPPGRGLFGYGGGGGGAPDMGFQAGTTGTGQDLYSVGAQSVGGGPMPGGGQNFAPMDYGALMGMVPSSRVPGQSVGAFPRPGTAPFMGPGAAGYAPFNPMLSGGPVNRTPYG